jgi:sugar phosphate isomerase/epimerase
VSQKDIRRYELLAKVVDESLTLSQVTQALGVNSISMHIGFVPEDTSNPVYAEVVAAAQKVCDYCHGLDQQFRLETGQETGECLKRFIGDVARPNLRVNFDPANMILYGSGEPIAALELVGKWVGGVHCKDGKWPTEKDQLGHEMPLGQGDVGIERFVQTLWKVGYRGALTIEREISGEQQLKDIMAAKKLLEGIRAEVMAAG